MERKRWVTIMAGGAFALAGTAAAATPALADDGPPPPSLPNLEVTAQWSTDAYGEDLLVMNVRNVGTTVAERPWLRVGATTLPATAFQPNCEEVQSGTTPGPLQTDLARTGQLRCRLAPLESGETRRVSVHLPSPVLAVGPVSFAPRSYTVSVAGDDGVAINVLGTAAFPPPPAISVSARRGQRLDRGFRLTIRARKAGTAQVSALVANPAAGWRPDGVNFTKLVRFSDRGTRTITLWGTAKQRRLMRNVLRHGKGEVRAEAIMTSRDNWGATYDKVTVPVTGR